MSEDEGNRDCQRLLKSNFKDCESSEAIERRFSRFKNMRESSGKFTREI